MDNNQAKIDEMDNNQAKIDKDNKLAEIDETYNMSSTVLAADNQKEMLEDGDYHTFEELNQAITDAEGEFNLEHDYKYYDCDIQMSITKSEEFTINGNNHIIEGLNIRNVILFTSEKAIIVNDLTFKNCHNASFFIESSVIFNNVKFIDCYGGPYDSLIEINSVDESVTLNRCTFMIEESNSPILNSIDNCRLVINNSIFSIGKLQKSGIIVRGSLHIENSTFIDLNSIAQTAINFKGWDLTIKKSRFVNLLSKLSAGVLMIKYFPNYIKDDDTWEIIGTLPNDPYLIEDCEFLNVSSANNGGAIHFDMDSGANHNVQTVIISNSNFTNCKSKYGGAISGLGGLLNISNSRFENNFASFEGGAIYTSWTNLTIANTALNNNSAEKNGGAIYFDKGKLTLKKSNFTMNSINEESTTAANCIYAYDVCADFADSIFDNGGISVYADFASDSKLVNNTKNDDIFLMDNKNYIVSVESKGIKLNLTSNNTIIVDELPSKFDSSEWGWVSPLKTQGDNDDCWAFATTATMESSLLKSTGVLYDLSQNYVQKLQLKYAKNGDLRNSLTGFAYSGLGYALSWYGVLPVDSDYDDRGMIADTDLNDSRIHLQDALIIFGNQSNVQTLIKEAIIKYGAVSIQLIPDWSEEEINSTGDDIAVMEHGTHFISLIGWNDELDNPEDEGHWLSKDSLGYFAESPSYTSISLYTNDYYAIIPQNAAIAYIFENDVDYHVNYQTDLTGLAGFDSNYSYYSNEFVSKYDEYIGAVGTYFNESGIQYSFDIYINDEKLYSQSGESEFAGFRTIKLDEYLPVKEGDVFKVLFKSNAVPFQAFSRQHYLEGMSMISDDGNTWKDISLENRTICLKVYTVENDKENQSNRISTVIDYKDMTTTAVASIDGRIGEYFTASLKDEDGNAMEGKLVQIGFNGKVYNRTTDANGKVRLQINLPKADVYTFALAFLADDDYQGSFAVAKITVNPQTPKLTTANKSYKSTAKTKALTATFKTAKGTAISGKKISFTLNGKTYTAKTNAKGVAKVNVILNKKGTYAFAAKFAGDGTYTAIIKKAKLTIK